jgi:ABC-type polar amino acid transport system ATPase subunit
MSDVVLRGVDLAVGRGEVLAVVGPSGSGKTTLLRPLNYLTPFDAGEVEVAGLRLRPGLCERRDAAALRALRLRVGMVFQSFHLFPHLTALDNVAEAARRLLGRFRAAVTHAIAFARQVASRVAVLVDGQIVEEGAV